METLLGLNITSAYFDYLERNQQVCFISSLPREFFHLFSSANLISSSLTWRDAIQQAMRLQLLINSSRLHTINHTKFSFLCSIYLSLLYLFIPRRAKVFGSRLFCDLGGSRLDLWQPISGDQNGWLGFGGWGVKRLCLNRLFFEKVKSSRNASDRQGQHRSSVMDVCHTCPR